MKSFAETVEGLMERELNVIDEWNHIFDSLKKMSKELQGVQIEKHLHCFRLSFIPFKMDSTRKIKSLQNQLLGRLKTQVL